MPTPTETITEQTTSPDNDPTFDRYCQGVPPLSGRIEPWMVQFLSAAEFRQRIEPHGSPVNVLNPHRMAENVAELNQIAAERQVDFRIFFARKANKCLSFVDQAHQLGIGVDTASEIELEQTLDRNLPPADVICTAAVKSESLIRRCMDNKICIAIDNHDEFERVRCLATTHQKQAIVALRLSGFLHGTRRLESRFGFDCERDRNLSEIPVDDRIRIIGLHFHLDGYDPHQRVTAIGESIRWAKRLRTAGHHPRFIDMGGGLPVCYLKHQDQWDHFWDQHAESLRGRTDEVTYNRNPLSRSVHQADVGPPQSMYPYYQSQTRATWLATVLDSNVGRQTVAQALKENGLQLRCEPGRSLLDGCGITIARIEFQKQDTRGRRLLGLSMNRTQCRTTSDDFLVDPLLIPSNREARTAVEGYLVGAYCMESELLSWRKFRFPSGVGIGDHIVFPNTAGYLMHFLESRSHQFPLAKNLVIGADGGADLRLDDIDR
ncbi:Y4yA family PLP-dependent enzyme [Crateriforma spongiae]|uniref:Y4yA family PLP-dependent enzyme n=1 Tax=Crateriforma spongiae TaxID=2724528 RepID=UPI001F2E641D|nr:Y4yA family PLP-dependent enzyme [Crateriforma spongiae]